MKFSELKSLYAELKNPGTEFRSLPFWAWNSRMQHDELRRQIQEAVTLDLRLAALAVAAAGAGLLASKTPRRTRR